MRLASSAVWAACGVVTCLGVVGACGSDENHPRTGLAEGGGGGEQGGRDVGGESAGGSAAKPSEGGLDAGGNMADGGRVSAAGAGAGQAGAATGDAGSGGADSDPQGASRAAAWSVRFGGTGQQQATALAAPLTGGGVVVVGQMEGTLVTSKKTLTSAGSYDAFAIKLDETGAVTWALSFGDAGDQRATAVAVDASGNVFIGGFTQTASSINFGTGTQTGGTFFIVEVNAAGAYQRGGVVPSDGNTRLKGLAIGPSDTLLYAADVPPGASLTAGCTTPYQNKFSNSGTTNVVAAVELTSTLQCVQDMGAGSDASLGIIYTSQNKLILPLRLPGSGQTPGSIVLQEFPFDKWSLSSTARASVAVQGAGGQLYWLSTAADGAGGLLLGGGYNGTAGVVNTAVLPSKTVGEAAFVAKADAAGAVTWSRSYGADASGRVASVSAASNSGRSFIAGFAQGILDFGDGPVLPIGKDVPSDNSYFVAALSGNGDQVWATRFALGVSAPTIAIASTLDDTLYATGSLEGTTNIGNGDLTSAGDDDLFVAQFAP